MKNSLFIAWIIVLYSSFAFTQVPISQFLSYNGRYDFTMFGRSNNVKGNTTPNFNCAVDNVSSSTADFTLPVTSTGIKRAILYWSGSGSGDLDVQLSGPNGLNNQALSSEKTYIDNVALITTTHPYFSASYDVTEILQTHGQGSYTLSGLDTDDGPAYCPNTIYSGWVIVVVYEDPTLPLNTVKLYDGFQGISATSINFSLDDVKITNPAGAKLAFVTWEGDNLPNLGSEGMSVNGHQLTNSLNPIGELFNSTNSFTNSSQNYNMDMDVFDIASFVNAGDTKLNIIAKAGNDVIFFNIFAITFNNELPDATTQANSYTGNCDNPDITLNYTVFNTQANDTLPAGVDVSFYANSPTGVFLGTKKTPSPLFMGDSVIQTIILNIPASLGENFKLYIVVDDGNSIKELEEGNNIYEYPIRMPITYNQVDNQGICDGDTLFWGGQTFTTSISQDFNYTSTFGCDSTVHLNLTVQPKQYTDIDISLCQGESYTLPDSTVVQDAGDYPVTISSQYGCDSVVTTHISILNESNFVELSGNNHVNLGHSIPLTLNNNFIADSIRWTPSDLVDCDSCSFVQASPYNDTWFTAYVYDEFGCLLTDSIQVTVRKKDEIYVPNVFSPDGNGINDFLEIYTDVDVKAILSFQVFDRWGSLVFDAKNIQASERQNIWNGFYKGKPLRPGVFVYQVVIQFIDDRQKVFAGDVTIVK